MKKLILEIHSGEGGEDARQFMKELYNVYRKYSSTCGFVFECIEESKSKISCIIEGKGVEDKFSLESGLHKVQRVSKTEQKGRRHTSIVAVAVLPYLTQKETNYPDRDFRIERITGQGPGGQKRNTSNKTVRITHLPTGLSAISGLKSQAKNTDNAMAVLLNRLQEIEDAKFNQKQSDKRMQQLSTRGRGSCIRNYMFHKGVVKDDRVGSFKIKKIMAGHLDLIYKGR